MPPSLADLAAFWLAEPTEATLSQARRMPGLALHLAGTGELAAAYADLLLLNVYPYASVFLEPTAELNGQRTAELEALYGRHGYTPPALAKAAAPDHLGLVLGYLDFVGQDAILPDAKYVLDWAPIVCLAVEREPGAHPFYRAVARLTREALLGRAGLEDHGPEWLLPLAVAGEGEDGEVTVRSIVRRLLAPARSGVFLSRNRLGQWARELGMPVPFGERFTVGVSLFEAAGIAGTVPHLLELLTAEAQAWDETYAAWAADWPAWASYAAPWRARTAETLAMLAEMGQQAGEDH